MKLIDLLVQELPKRGGWPQNALSITQDNDGSLCVWDTNDPHYDGFSWKHHTGNSLIYFWCGGEDMPLSSNHKESIVTYWQYKAALAASQKPAWNGEGLPPSGVECEARLRCNDGEWFFFRCVGVDCGVAFGWAGKEAVTLGKGSYEFRPLRTESEKKRDAFINAVLDDMRVIPCDLSLRDEVAVIYDAIAAGKIPGVKLDD
ncbi:TPA: hypothetical protein QCK47_004461 [Salmonella enterica subsp. enterica serovar Derby]|nr:hypothetical protein [Salmonella enterica subsp. enterica serovar Derby]